jgi:hypothetical protein
MKRPKASDPRYKLELYMNYLESRIKKLEAELKNNKGKEPTIESL